MTERRTPGVPGDATRVVTLQPGQSVVIEAAPSVVLNPSAEAKRLRIKALSDARDFFHENAADIALLMGGDVADRDSVQMDSGVRLREVVLGLMDVGIDSDEVVRNVQRSVLARPGMIDPMFASDAARSYGRLLTEERERVLEERITVEGAPKPAPKPRQGSRS